MYATLNLMHNSNVEVCLDLNNQIAMLKENETRYNASFASFHDRLSMLERLCKQYHRQIRRQLHNQRGRRSIRKIFLHWKLYSHHRALKSRSLRMIFASQRSRQLLATLVRSFQRWVASTEEMIFCEKVCARQLQFRNEKFVRKIFNAWTKRTLNLVRRKQENMKLEVDISAEETRRRVLVENRKYLCCQVCLYAIAHTDGTGR